MKLQVAAVLIIAGAMVLVAMSGIVNAVDDQITIVDPTGDVFVSGDGIEEVEENVDIVSLQLSYNSFPNVVDLKVDGVIDEDYSGTTYQYSYMILMDFDHDNTEDVTLTYTIPSYMSGMEMMITWDEGGGMGFVDSGDWSIDGGNTLSVELDEEYMGGFSEDMDFSAVASATNLQTYGSATDGVERDGGTSDDDVGDDDTGDDDTGDDDWDDDITDPGDDEPTDDSIDIDIDDFSFSLDENETEMEMIWSVTGTTSGDVHHCSITAVMEDKDGSQNYMYGGWMEGSFDYSDEDTVFYFKGTGSGGDDDWSTWEFYMKSTVEKEEMDDDSTQDEADDLKEAILYVRAFSDESEDNWNQDSTDITSELKDAAGVGGGDSDDSPGFEVSLAVMAFVSIAVGLVMVTGRKR